MNFDSLLKAVRDAANDSGRLQKLANVIKQSRNAHGDSLLHVFAAEGDSNAVMALLKLGCDVNATNNFGSSVIECPAWRGHKQVVECLLKAGADLSRPDNTGFTPIENLRLLGKDKMADWMMAAGGRKGTGRLGTDRQS